MSRTDDGAAAMTSDHMIDIRNAWAFKHGQEARDSGWGLIVETSPGGGRYTLIVNSHAKARFQRAEARKALRKMYLDEVPAALAAMDLLLKHNPDEFHRVIWEG